MKHRKENHQCCRVDVVEEIIHKVVADESPSSPMDRDIVNSIEVVEEEFNK